MLRARCFADDSDQLLREHAQVLYPGAALLLELLNLHEHGSLLCHSLTPSASGTDPRDGQFPCPG